VARRLAGFERALDAPRLFAVAYDELGSSLYFALGIVAAEALGLTPVVLLLSGLLVLVVAQSYAEGTAALPQTGGAATFVRRACNDLAGFVTGWAVLLDFLIVTALASLFLPHYLGIALSQPSLREPPWDVVTAVFVILGITLARAIRRSRLHAGALAVAIVDLTVQALLIVLGFTFLFSGDVLVDGLSLETEVGWSDLAFALPLAMLAYTGLETVANLAAEAREPGRSLPRSLITSIGLVVTTTVLIGAIAVTAFPAENGSTAIGDEWLEAPLEGIVAALGETSLPAGLVDVLRVVVGISGTLVLLTAATTSMSGVTRITQSLGEHGQLPRELGRLERRTVVSGEAILLVGAVAVVLVIVTGTLGEDDPVFLASIYSFGVLLAFTAAQLAILRLRMKEPSLERPFRARPEVTVAGHRLPLLALVGAPLTAAVFVLAMITHPGARYAGPAWLAAGVVVYLVTRRIERHGVLEDVDPFAKLPAGTAFGRMLVPMKLGPVGEEMVATAVALAKERGASVEAITVVRVPRRYPLEGELPPAVEARAAASLEEARALGEDHGVEVRTSIVVARSIGHAIVDEARDRAVDVIVLGSAPRWRRQSRFFSPTVDHVLRNAPCEVLVVAFPEGVLEEEPGSWVFAEGVR
jgi:APA family basic amino acid/polyamine antiporter